MTAQHLLFLLGVPFFSVVVSALARRFDLSGPLVLVVVGLLVSIAPFIPDYDLEPEFVLMILLPPLLYQAAVETSVPSLRENWSAVLILSVAMVLVTTLLTGFAMHWLIPGMPLPVAFVLGAVLGPPDTVAAISIAKRLGLPRRTVDVLVGEGLFNDATALTAFRIALAAAVGETVTVFDAVGRFVLSAAGGIVIGAVVAMVWDPIRFRMRDPRAESAISLILPFVVYITAEAVHVSGVMGVVILGLYLGHRRVRAGYATRMLDTALWDVIVEILEATVFALIGLQLIPILRDVDNWGAWQLIGYGMAAFTIVVLARFGGVYTFGYIGGFLVRHLRRNAPLAPPPPQTRTPRILFVVGWAGMRGVVSLAAAAAIPLTDNHGGPLPDRELVQFLTLFVVLATLIVQGLTLPPLIRRLGVEATDEVKEDAFAYCSAMGTAATAGLARLDELEATLPDPAVDRMRDQARWRGDKAKKYAMQVASGGPSASAAAVEDARRSMLDAERAAIEHLRDLREINDDVYRRVLHQLDLEEAYMERR
ncbi:Na+/H+ antiporter [Catenulispora sp. EB89]|uniref:Na+/H+ antiporter n=1 Tax=Catenulispora sp. EB89 TaxID=3156257 RepID=UPI0035111852